MTPRFRTPTACSSSWPLWSRDSGLLRLESWGILGDGAPWIWDRVEGFVNRLGYDRANVTEVLDFYHACEHITEATSVVKRFSEARQRVWCRRLKWLLRSGRVETMLSELEEQKTLIRMKHAERYGRWQTLPGGRWM